MVFKRPLSIPSTTIDENSVFTKSKFCKVCGDEARIINYGALSCQSCKTFFRRIGFRPNIVRPCRRNGQCKVNISTRKLCAACRLTKCISVGMSRDLIRKEISYTTKYSFPTGFDQTQISKCRKLMCASQLPTLDLLEYDRSSLTNSQWTLFSNVLHAFERFSLIPTLKHILKNMSSSPSEIYFEANDALETIGSIYTSIQSFVSCTPDFQVLTINEQQSLFERNLHGIGSFYSNLIYRETGLLDNQKLYQTYVTAYGLETMEQSNHLVHRTYLDSTLFKLILIIIAFSPNCFIVDVHENIQNDSLIFGTFRLYGSQNVYIELLWKYMLYRYGFKEAVHHLDNLVKHLLDMIELAGNVYKNHQLHHDFVDEVVEKTKEQLIISQNEPIVLWGKTLASN